VAQHLRQQLVRSDFGCRVAQRNVEREWLVVNGYVLVLISVEHIIHDSIACGTGVGLGNLGSDCQRFRPGKCTERRKTMRKTFGRFHLQRVVPGSAHRVPINRDVAELREWTQSLRQQLAGGETRIWDLESASHNSRITHW